MKFSKLVLLPLLALGLAACGPVASSSEVVPGTSTSESSSSQTESLPEATDWEPELKALMEEQIGFVVPFFTLEGEWGTTEDGSLMYISDPEVNVTKEDFFGKLALPLLQGGLVDSTYKYDQDALQQAVPGSMPFILSHIDVQEKQTVLDSIIIWYVPAGVMGEGTLGSALITNNVQPEVYTSREVKDDDIKSKLAIAFPGQEVPFPAMEAKYDGKVPYADVYGEAGYFQVLLGASGSIENLEAIVASFTELGWIFNPEGDEDPATFYLGYESEDPQYKAVARIMPDLALVVAIMPFTLA